MGTEAGGGSSGNIAEGRAIVSTANGQAQGGGGLPSPQHSDPIRRVPLREGEGRCGSGEKKAGKEELGRERREGGGKAKPLTLPPPQPALQPLPPLWAGWDKGVGECLRMVSTFFPVSKGED